MKYSVSNVGFRQGFDKLRELVENNQSSNRLTGDFKVVETGITKSLIYNDKRDV